jgi:hypothetical protein
MLDFSQQPAGLSPETCSNSSGESERVPERPLSAAWISPGLLAKTKRVWSKNYGRRVDDDEAVEILQNTRRLAEALVKLKGGVR